MSEPNYAAIIEEVLAIERSEAERQGEELSSRPRSGASEKGLAKAEATRGRKFPESYRAFLRTCNGWEFWSWGVSLFGTKELRGEAYDDAAETLSYTEDLPEELSNALIIGKNENDATVFLLLDSGEVVDHLYEEKHRYPDLAACLRSRVATLERMRARALAAIARTEAQWDPAVREADDRALAEELRQHLATYSPSPVAAAPGAIAGASATPAPAQLVATRDGERAAALDLGLVLYLGAPPTKDETLQTFRAFRRAFPTREPQAWQLASPTSFFPTTEQDPDAEPFASALRIDDEGYFGLRVVGGTPERQYILNVRGIPPQEDDDDEDAPPARRASFVEVLVPADESAERLRALTEELVDVLPVRSGHGGYFARVRGTGAEPDPWNDVFGWCRRYFAIEPCYVDGWLEGALRRHRGAGWLTVLGRAFVDALGPLTLPAGVTAVARRCGTVLVAGGLGLGDVARGEFPEEIASVARLLEPVTITTWARHGTFSIGGVWFSTFASQLPGAFSDHHATEAFLRRFVDPARFLGPTARELGLALAVRLHASMDEAAREKWEVPIDSEDLSFRDLLRALYNGAYYTPVEELRVEALELAARFPSTAVPATYNNLLLAYLRAGRLDDALALMPVALRTAAEGQNPQTYHNAACVFAKVGRLEDALDCVARAKDEGYQQIDRLESDDDLIALRALPGWREIFAPKPS